MNQVVSITSPDRGEAQRALWAFALFLLVWTAYVGLLWRPQALPVMTLYWLKVPVWLLPVAVLAAMKRGWVRDFGLAGPPLRALAFAAAAVALVALKDAARLAWIDGRAPVWSPPLATLLMGVAPLLEELLFRGALQPALVRRFGAWLGILVSSLLFWAIHLPGWVLLQPHPAPFTVVYVFGIGLFLGWLRHASGSLWAPLAAHWANNIGARL